MVSLGAKNLNSNILEKYLEMAYFTTFGPKIEMLSVKIGPNGKKVDGIWSKTEIITKIYSDSYILIFSDSPLLFSQLCQTEEIERNKRLKISSSSIGRFLDTEVFYNIVHRIQGFKMYHWYFTKLQARSQGRAWAGIARPLVKFCP